MVTYVRMPKLTWTMEEGIVGEWHKKVGDQVEKGTVLCEIETEKSVDELKAPESGVLRKILFLKGSVVKVNEEIAIIAAADEALPDEDRVMHEKMNVKTRAVEATLQSAEAAPSQERIESKVSPAARKLAEDRGISLSGIEGTGPNGRVVREDVLKATEKAPHVKTVRLSRMREVIKNRLSLSMRNALHVPLTMDVDMTEALRMIQDSRTQMELKHEIHLTPTSILIKAVANALEKHQILNSRFIDGQIEIPEEINIGVAVALEEGLVVPVVHNAHKKTLEAIAKEISELTEKARTGSLSTEESTGGTFTISNLGMFGIDLFAPIINPPESAILGVGRIVKKPAILDDKVVPRYTMTVTVVFDHRIMDGAIAARFLQTLKERLENPIGILD